MALGKAGFALGVRPVASLRPHEEVIPKHVDQLCSEIERDGMQRDPIIIDRESAAVLDGMHRLAAFQKLGFENAVCCSVDYSSPSVTIGRWARVYTMKEGDSVRMAVESFTGAKRVRLAEAFSSLQRREEEIAILTGDAAFVVGGGGPMAEVTAAMESLDGLAGRKRWVRTFVPEDDVDIPLQKARAFVVLPRRLTKEDVITAARSGSLFPCKTSMHVIDPRPVAVNYPLDGLHDATAATLKEKLRGKGGRVLPKGSEYGGRRYKERLVLLDQE